MAEAYSKDLRRRVVAFVERGNSRQAAARQFGVSPSFAVKLLQLWQETGSVTPRPVGGRRHAKLAPYLDYLIREVEAQPDVTMPELARRLASEHGVSAAPASLSRVLCQAGFTYKKSAAGGGARARRRQGGPG
jgi:transposase